MKGGKIGDDYTKKYSDNQGTMIEFEKSGKSVEFKPFLKSFSVNRKISDRNTQKSESMYGVTKIVYDTELPTYSLSFSVVSNSINESIDNHKKIQELFRMVYPKHAEDITETIFSKIYIKISNMMNIGSVFGLNATGGIGETKTKGINCSCSKLSYKVDMEMGVFEHAGFILPKKFDVTLSISTQDNRFKLRI